MSKIDFYVLAMDCIDDVKNHSYRYFSNYRETLFFAISNKNVVRYSASPNVLFDAHQCILIHRFFDRHRNYDCYRYIVQYINSDGTIHQKDKLENGFEFSFDHDGLYDFSIALGYHYKSSYYALGFLSIKQPDLDWEKNIQKLWSAYSLAKDLETDEEIRAFTKILYNNETILRTENEIRNTKMKIMLQQIERDNFKSILDEFKNLIAPQNE